jgi:hypothetical protein
MAILTRGLLIRAEARPHERTRGRQRTDVVSATCLVLCAERGWSYRLGLIAAPLLAQTPVPDVAGGDLKGELKCV